jgi:transcriptional regulator with XRE-family HTH domain
VVKKNYFCGHQIEVMRVKIGLEIKKLRKMQRFTQDHIAQKLDMSVAGYSRIERDEVNVTLDRLQELSDILGTTPEFLLGIESEKENGLSKDASVDKIERLYLDQIEQLKDEIAFLRSQLRVES